MELEEYTQYQETQLHEQPGFAYNTYLCTIPVDFPRVSLHWHNQMETIYIKKGSGTVTVDFVPYAVSEGCIVPVLPGELHSIEGTPKVRMEYENIIFSLELLDSQEADDWCRDHILQSLKDGQLRFPRPIRPGSEFHTAAALALDQADAACEQRAPGFSLLVKSNLFLFLHALYRFRDSSVTTESHPAAEKLKRLLSYVKLHYGEELTVQTAAEVMGYSLSHFMRLFRQETGQTFVEYLTDYRLTAASYYLKETPDSVGEISSRCGFDNFSYFIRKFRQKYELSPGQYRKRYRASGKSSGA